MRDKMLIVTSGTKELAMLDLLFVVLTVGFFAVTLLLIPGFERLKGGD
jgi:hypothetical protein